MEQIKEQLTDIKSMNMDELTEFIISLGEKKFRAKQIYEWIHVKHVESFDEMTNISKKFIQVLKEIQQYLFDNRIVQPFKQVFRELYLKLPEELDLEYTKRYTGYQIQTKQAAGALKKCGWNVGLQEQHTIMSMTSLTTSVKETKFS
jgi:hypothetical protein